VQHQKRRGETFFCPTFFCTQKYHKFVNNFIFEEAKKFFLAKTLITILLFTQKFVMKLSKIWVWDLGSEKNLFRIPDPGSKRHWIPEPEPWIPDPDPQHCFQPIEETYLTPSRPFPFVFYDRVKKLTLR
jgi:hypothetical protein